MVEALLWDVDGTLAETERDGHRVAFNLAFESMGLSWRWDEARYGELLRVTGGYERILQSMRERRDAPGSAAERDQLARELHRRKNAHYAALLDAQGIELRPGVREMFDECQSEGVRMALVTTTSRANLAPLLAHNLGKDWSSWFAVAVCGEDVAVKKPAPDAYLLALQWLEVGPLSCIAIEDSPGGVASARSADVPVVVTRSVYFKDATIDGAIAIGPGLHRRDGWRPALSKTGAGGTRVTLDDLREWHARMEFVSGYGDAL